jgi:tol-pal system protein YbgF
MSAGEGGAVDVSRLRRAAAGVILLVSLTLATASPVVSAQSARDRLDALEARTAQLEAVLQGQALGELSSRVDELSAQLRALRGELETQGQEQVALRKQLGELAAELDRRLAAPTPAAPVAPATPVAAAPVAAAPVEAATVAAAAVAPAVPSSAPARPAPVPATPEGPDTLGAVQRYQLAFEALRASDHPKAIAGFEDMIARYPDHALATNARYWLGRSLLLQNEPARAVDAFAGALASGTLDAGRVPDALLKKAQAELQLGRRDAARATLDELIARYPDGEPARQARALLTP